MKVSYASPGMAGPVLCLCSAILLLQGGEGQATQAEKEIGIQPLIQLHGRSPRDLILQSVRPLFSKNELETYLEELEGPPPDWERLASQNLTEQSERLFAYNRQRDHIRDAQPSILQRPVAFLWSGELRQYLEDYQGFSVAVGPTMIPTSWGLVRFKPRDVPNFMIATVPGQQHEGPYALMDLRKGQEIGVLFIGTLVETESIIYGFSHDGDHEGMILPVVEITAIKYFLPEP